MSKNWGFTLLELMVAIAVAAILLALGVPSFSGSVRRNQGVTDANTVLGLLTLARGEAIKRGGTVTLCASADGAACDTSNSASWEKGYVLVYQSTVLKADVPLSISSAITGGAGTTAAVSFNGSGTAGSYAFNTGTFTSGGATLSVAPKSQPKFTRCVVVYQSGRAFVRDPSGSNYVCT